MQGTWLQHWSMLLRVIPRVARRRGVQGMMCVSEAVKRDVVRRAEA